MDTYYTIQKCPMVSPQKTYARREAYKHDSSSFTYKCQTETQLRPSSRGKRVSYKTSK